MIRDYPAQPGRSGYVILKTEDPGVYCLVRDCLCDTEARVMVMAQGLWDWEHGKFVQDAMPELSQEAREQVLTGIHPGCWEKLMKFEEDAEVEAGDLQ